MHTRSLDPLHNAAALPGTETVTIRPLSFVDTLAHVGTFVDGTVGQDVDFRLVERSRMIYVIARWVILPLYFQWRCAGYGAFRGERLAGLMYVRNKQEALHVDAIAVHPDFRRQGIGRGLLQFAERQARTAGRQQLSLRVTLSNEPAVRLYKSEGFRRAHLDSTEPPAAKVTMLKTVPYLPKMHEQEDLHGD